ncbi:MAG TPA: hypothetical protein ENN08_02805 [Bacteroidales bacterium]|nr:hypothetical protein [Bacteroidales bacterium]
MNELIGNKGVNALLYCCGEALSLPGHKWPGNGAWWVEKSVVRYSIAQRSVAQFSGAQPSIAQRSVAQFSGAQFSIAQRFVAQFSEAQFSKAQRFVAQFLEAQFPIAQRFSAGIRNAPEPISAEGVYALLIPGKPNRKGRKRPPAVWSGVFSSPGVNARATEPDGVRAQDTEMDSLNTRAKETAESIYNNKSCLIN